MPVTRCPTSKTLQVLRSPADSSSGRPLALPLPVCSRDDGRSPRIPVIYWCTASMLLHQIKAQGSEPGAAS